MTSKNSCQCTFNGFILHYLVSIELLVKCVGHLQICTVLGALSHIRLQICFKASIFIWPLMSYTPRNVGPYVTLLVSQSYSDTKEIVS